MLVPCRLYTARSTLVCECIVARVERVASFAAEKHGVVSRTLENHILSKMSHHDVSNLGGLSLQNSGNSI